jgi:hypothetical protein
MKKIENLLLLPFLFALYGVNRASANLLSIAFHDSYFVINPAGVSMWFLCYLIVLFLLYKVIRMRHQTVNWLWATGHITFTFFLIVTVWWSFEYSGSPLSGFSLSKSDDFAAWVSYNRVLVFSALTFSLIQVVFWIWFILQMIRKQKAVQQ